MSTSGPSVFSTSGWQASLTSLVLAPGAARRQPRTRLSPYTTYRAPPLPITMVEGNTCAPRSTPGLPDTTHAGKHGVRTCLACAGYAAASPAWSTRDLVSPRATVCSTRRAAAHRAPPRSFGGTHRLGSLRPPGLADRRSPPPVLQGYRCFDLGGRRRAAAMVEAHEGVVCTRSDAKSLAQCRAMCHASLRAAMRGISASWWRASRAQRGVAERHRPLGRDGLQPSTHAETVSDRHDVNCLGALRNGGYKGTNLSY
jgi:hypothetical protein